MSFFQLRFDRKNTIYVADEIKLYSCISLFRYWYRLCAIPLANRSVHRLAFFLRRCVYTLGQHSWCSFASLKP